MEKYIEFRIFPRKERDRKLKASDLEPDAFAALCTQWPQFANKHSFSGRLPADSDELNSVIRSIETFGKTAHWKRFPKIGYYSETQFQLKGSREFSKDEIESADFLHAIPADEIATSGGHLDSGALFAQPQSVKRRVRLGRVSGSSTAVCDEEFRRTLEGENLTGLEFRDVTYDYKGAKKHPPIWQLWSDVVLPRLQNPLHICEEGPGAGFHIDDLYSPQIPMFEIDSFKQVDDFDVAITTERLGGGIDRARDPLLIVSKHVRTVFDQLELSLNYIPVRLTDASNRVGTGIEPAPPTPPAIRV